jgi:hypothetical protein
MCNDYVFHEMYDKPQWEVDVDRSLEKLESDLERMRQDTLFNGEKNESTAKT